MGYFKEKVESVVGDFLVARGFAPNWKHPHGYGATFRSGSRQLSIDLVQGQLEASLSEEESTYGRNLDEVLEEVAPDELWLARSRGFAWSDQEVLDELPELLEALLDAFEGNWEAITAMEWFTPEPERYCPCPKCGFDIFGQTEVGCPQCKWGREPST